MPSTKKIELVKKLNETLKGVKGLILTNYQGLSTFQLEKLKRDVEKAHGKVVVAKNTLLKVVFRQLKIKLPETILKGPTAVVLTFDEGLEALKSLVAFAKKSEGRPSLRLSFIDGQIYDQNQSLTLASLESREILLAKFLGHLSSPLRRLVTSLKSDQRKLVLVLNQVARLRQV